MVDLIPVSRTVMFVGDYFSLVTTVTLDEKLRNEGEGEWDFAVRLASVLIDEYYGFDVASVSNSIGVVDENQNEVDEYE